MAWHKVGNLGEQQDGMGHSLTYGDFGTDTWGLHMTIDGESAILAIRDDDTKGAPSIADRADALITKFESGWLPINWEA